MPGYFPKNQHEEDITVYPAFVEISEYQNKKLANDELINTTFEAVKDIPIACEIMDKLIDGFKDGDDIEVFMYRIGYVIRSISTYTNDLSKCLKAAGYNKPIEY